MNGGTVFWHASRIAFDQRPGVGAPERDGPAIFWIAAGRPVAYFSALTSVAEARGFNAYYLARKPGWLESSA